VARIQLILACVGPHLLNEDTAASLVETVRNCSHQRRAGQSEYLGTAEEYITDKIPTDPDIRGVIMYLFVLDVVGRRPALVPRFPEWWSRALAIVDQFKTLYAQVQRQVAKEMIKLAVMVLPQANTAVAIEKNAGEQQIEMAAEVKQEQTAHDMIASSLAIQRLTEEYANAGSAGRKGAGRLRQNW
jgi:hypothetical protein